MERKILYNQANIYQEIVRLFKGPTVRRVAVSAFVGKGAESYLPNPKGITLVCWPKAGGTNPHALRKLMARKVDVWFADRVHMKVYWAEGRGCVLASANLSTNALGSGNLKEIGILIGDDEIDIDQVLLSLEKRSVTDREMRTLDRAHARFVVTNQLRERSSIRTFENWFRSPSRQGWKVGWGDVPGNPSVAAKEKAREETGESKLADWLCVRRGAFKSGEWILFSWLATDSPTNTRWLFSHGIVEVSPKDEAYDKGFPCQVYQIWPSSRYPGCPFVIDRPFRKALRAAVNGYGAERLRGAKSMEPPKELLESISAYFRQATSAEKTKRTPASK